MTVECYMLVWICLLLGLVVYLLYGVGILSGIYSALFLMLVPGILFLSGTLFKKTHLIVLKISIVSLGLVVSLVGVDLCLRFFDLNQIFYRPHEKLIELHPVYAGLYRYAPNSSVTLTSSGDLAAIGNRPEARQFRAINFITDQWGFRNSPEAGQNPVNLMVLGDSCAMGEGTDQKDCFSEILKNKYGWNVYNLSFPGGPWLTCLNFGLYAHLLPIQNKAHLVWIIFSGNDLQDYYGPHCSSAQILRNPLSRQMKIQWQNFRSHSPLHRLLLDKKSSNKNPVVIESSFLETKSLLFYRNYYLSSKYTEQDVRRHPNSHAFQLVMKTLVKKAHEKGMTPWIFLAPSKEEVYLWALEGRKAWSHSPKPSAFSEFIKKTARAQNVFYYDLKPDYIRHSKTLYEQSSNILYWTDDTHWNEHGHALAANIIHQNLKKIYD